MGCQAVLLPIAMPCSRVRSAGWTTGGLGAELIVLGEAKLSVGRECNDASRQDKSHGL